MKVHTLTIILFTETSPFHVHDVLLLYRTLQPAQRSLILRPEVLFDVVRNAMVQRLPFDWIFAAIEGNR